MKDIKLRNPNITTSELGEERTFVSGIKNWRVEWAEIYGQRFTKGNRVSYFDEDSQKTYEGFVDWIIVTENGYCEVSICNTPLGRIDLEELVKLKIKPRHPDIVISKPTRSISIDDKCYLELDWAEINGERFDKGDEVSSFDYDIESEPEYTGLIKAFYLNSDLDVVVSIDNAILGMIALEFVEHKFV